MSGCGVALVGFHCRNNSVQALPPDHQVLANTTYFGRGLVFSTIAQRPLPLNPFV